MIDFGLVCFDFEMAQTVTRHHRLRRPRLRRPCQVVVVGR